MKYYQLTWNSKSKKGPVAYVESEDRPSYVVARGVFDSEELPFLLSIRHVTETNSGLLKDDEFENGEALWIDYMPNQFAWPLFSEKAKDIFLKTVTDGDRIKWILANIEFQGNIKPYYVLQFDRCIDALDVSKTSFVPGTNAIIKPVFSKVKVENLSVFHRPASNDLWKITSSIYVSEILKNNLIKAKCTNFEFSLAKVE